MPPKLPHKAPLVTSYLLCGFCQIAAYLRSHCSLERGRPTRRVVCVRELFNPSAHLRHHRPRHSFVDSGNGVPETDGAARRLIQMLNDFPAQGSLVLL